MILREQSAAEVVEQEPVAAQGQGQALLELPTKAAQAQYRMQTGQAEGPVVPKGAQTYCTRPETSKVKMQFRV